MRNDRVGERRGAFTLIELLVVVAIIALLVSILLPSLRAARESAKAAVCASNVHQLMLGITYYAQDNKSSLPWIPGKVNSSGNNPYCSAPYSQYYQLFRFYPYVRELKAYRCPSAKDQNSVKSLFNVNDPGASVGTDPNPNTSLYFVRKSDDFYLQVAYPKQYWPEYDPFDVQFEEFEELYTEYWWNDFHSAVCRPLVDSAKQKLPAMNGGKIDSIPGPQYAVPLAEYGWGLPAEQLRHNGKINLGFLDGHATLYRPEEFYDTVNKLPAKTDQDGFGSRPFYAWGLTRNATDWLGR